MRLTLEAANAWAHDVALRLAFGSIGRGSSHPTRDTSHVLDAIASVSLAGRVATNDAIKAWKAYHLTNQSHAAEDAIATWGVVRGLGATPIHTTFAT